MDEKVVEKDIKQKSDKELVRDILEKSLIEDQKARIKSPKNQLELEKIASPSVIERIKVYLLKTEKIEKYEPDIHGPLVSFEGLENYEEIERYWVKEPYAFVVILNNIETKEELYYVVEPELSPFEDVFLREIKDRLRDVLLVEDIIEEKDKEKVLKEKVKSLIKDYAIKLTPPMLEKILYYVIRDYINFGPIDAIQNDDRIEDVSCNGFNVPIYLYHKQYTNIATNVVFQEDELDSFIIRLAQRCGKHISVAEPMIDATMPDGSRIQMTLSTHITAHGGTFTIRKFSDEPLTPIDLIIWGTFSAETMAYLWLCIENNKSLIFAGGTASGKTSSLNAVALFIPRQAKVITLEDTRELKLPHPNWIPSVTRDAFTADERGAIDMYELLRAALRQRPEFLLVGEVRGKEALTLFQAMSTGHTTFSTMHADSVASAIHRLENPPISVPRSMIQALNIISIQSQTYTKGKRVRRNLKMVEITDIDPQTRNIRTNDIFNWDSMTDEYQQVGESKALNDIMIRRAWSPKDLKLELKYRQMVLEFLAVNKIVDYNTVSTIIYEYFMNPDKVLKKLKIIE
jgi:flagellar protein FlaI